jgi:hypothetical protein
MTEPIRHLDGRSRSRERSDSRFSRSRFQKLALVFWSSVFIVMDSAYATGGGLLTVVASQTGNGLCAFVQVALGPPAAVAAGAALRVQGTTTWFTDPTYTFAVAEGTTAIIECRPVPGWNLPTNNTVQIPLGELTVVLATYMQVVPPAAPALTFNPASGLGITGTAGATFRLEYRTSLVSGQWLPLKTNNLGPGVNLLLPWPPTNGPAAFYRAVWLP